MILCQVGFMKISEKVLNNLIPHVEGKIGSVVHNDLDGLLTGLYFNNKTGLSIQGIFNINSQANMDSQLYTTTKKMKEYIYLDCSIIHKDLTVIDHHVMPVQAYNYSSNNFNCNYYHEASKDIKKYGSFLHKNPTGCISWLLYIMGEDISKYSLEQKMLICMSDSLYINFNDVRYKQNCIDWLKLLHQEELIEVLERPNIIAEIDDLKAQIGIVGNGYQVYDNGTFKSYKTNYTTQEVLNNISDIMEWKQVNIPVFNFVCLFDNKKYYCSQIDYVLANTRNLTCAIRTISRNPIMYVSEFYDIQSLNGETERLVCENE